MIVSSRPLDLIEDDDDEDDDEVDDDVDDDEASIMWLSVVLVKYLEKRDTANVGHSAIL